MEFFEWTRGQAIEKAERTGIFPSWLKKLTAIAVFGETSNATQPDEVLMAVVRVFLNRIEYNLKNPDSFWGKLGRLLHSVSKN